MTLKKILEILNEEEYEYYGIRVDECKYDLGEECNYSHQLFLDPLYDDDGELVYEKGTGIYGEYYDAGELDGTCAIKINSENVENALNLVSDYYGNYIHLIAGYNATNGEDTEEIIIQDAVVLMAESK